MRLRGFAKCWAIRPRHPRYIETLPRRGYRFIERVDEVKPEASTLPASRSRDFDPRGIQAVAVLPLQDLSGERDHDYFADGMTEALITSLAKISALRVISRTSAMQYKGAQKSLPQIARELNVDAVIEGSVLRSGERVRITAQLIHAAATSTCGRKATSVIFGTFCRCRARSPGRSPTRSESFSRLRSGRG